MTQLSKVKQNIHQHKDKSCNLKKHKKSNSRPNRAVWTVFTNCAHWRGSTLAIYKTVLKILPLNLQTITISLDVVRASPKPHKGGRSKNTRRGLMSVAFYNTRPGDVMCMEGYSAAVWKPTRAWAAWLDTKKILALHQVKLVGGKTRHRLSNIRHTHDAQ